MTDITVSAFTQQAIEDAAFLAGANGRVFFPNGEYDVEDLETIHDGQTWIFGRSAKVNRLGGSNILTVRHAALELVGGIFDGGPDSEKNGISVSADLGLRATRTIVVNAGNYGFAVFGGECVLRDCKAINSGRNGIFWKSEQFRSSGPLIENCEVLRTLPFYKSSGGIIVITEGNASQGKRVISAPKIIGCKVTLPQTPNLAAAQGAHADAVCIELRGASTGVAAYNTTTYGHIGVSFVDCQNSKMIGNDASSQFQYGLELAGGSTWNILSANSVKYVNGQAANAAAPSRAVSISEASNDNRIVTTTVLGCSTGVVWNGDCLRNAVS